MVGGGAVLLTAGCSPAKIAFIGLPTPASDQAQRMANLWHGSWITAWSVGALVWGLILWSVFRYRKRGDHLPVQTRYNIPIELLYTVVPFIIVAVLFFFTARDQNAITTLSKQTPAHVVNVNGMRWSWQFNYVENGSSIGTVTGTPTYEPTLYLPVGEKVRFHITSSDVNHSFWVPAFLFKMDAIPQRINTFDLTPTRTGTFAGRCAELCGTYHARMLFKVVVLPADQFEAQMTKIKGGATS